MDKLKRGEFLITLFFLLLFFGCGLWFSASELLAQDKIIAVVNKEIITQKDLSDFINFMRVQLSTEYKGQQLEGKIQSMKLDLLNKLIEDRIILQEAKKEGIMLNPDRIKSKISEIKNHYGSDKQFQDAIAKQGLVEADIEKKIEEQGLMYYIIERQVKSKISVKPSEVTDYYQQNINKFTIPEQREFESITVGDKALAFDIGNKLIRGQALNDIANRYNIEINKFNAARDGQLRKDVEDILFKLSIGQTSEPINIENSYYFFKLNNIVPPHQRNLSEAQEDIHAILFNKKMQEDMAKWLDELKSHSYINILKN